MERAGCFGILKNKALGKQGRLEVAAATEKPDEEAATAVTKQKGKNKEGTDSPSGTSGADFVGGPSRSRGHGRVKTNPLKKKGNNQGMGSLLGPTSATDFVGGPSRSRGHVWGKTNPLKFPPCQYTEDVYKINNPFIQVVHGERKMPHFNKFGLQLEVSPLVRNLAIQECTEDLAECFNLYAKAKTKKQLVEYHHSLVRKLERLTIPSEDTLYRLQQRQLEYERYGNGRKRKQVDISNIEDFLADQTGLLLDLVDERVSMDEDGKLSVNQDFEIAPENAPLHEPDAIARSGSSDMKLYVNSRPKSFVKNPKKLVSIFEFKFLDSDDSGYQGACYASAEAPTNIKNGHSNPIYVVSLSEKWKYSILHVRGQISIKNGTIDLTSIPGFRKTEMSMGFKSISEVELNKQLEEGTEFLQAHYSDAPHFLYPDGKYRVGILYVSDVWRGLPTDKIAIARDCDTQHFYTGMLRIILGDCVTTWTGEMANKVIQARKKIRNEEKELLMGETKEDATRAEDDWKRRQLRPD